MTVSCDINSILHEKGHQLWTISPNGGRPRQLTRNPWPVTSTFTWSPDGRHIAHAMDHSVCLTDTRSGETRRVTAPGDGPDEPRSEACVFSPDGKKIAFIRRISESEAKFNQVFIVALDSSVL